MAETPEGPMPGRVDVVETPEGTIRVGKKSKFEEKLEARLTRLYYKSPEYQAATELVRMLRGLGILVRVKCPKCGSEGTLSVLAYHGGYNYVVVRHPDKSTHTVTFHQLHQLREALCEVKKDLERILNQFKKCEEKGFTFCLCHALS